MGWPSSHEHDQEKHDDAIFLDQEMAPDLKALLDAPRKLRKPRDADQSPKAYDLNGQATQQARYRKQVERTKARDRIRDAKFAHREAAETALDENQNLHALAMSQAKLLGPEAPYFQRKLDQRAAHAKRRLRPLRQLLRENSELTSILAEQAVLMKAARRRRHNEKSARD